MVCTGVGLWLGVGISSCAHSCDFVDVVVAYVCSTECSGVLILPTSSYGDARWCESSAESEVAYVPRCCV